MESLNPGTEARVRVLRTLAGVGASLFLAWQSVVLFGVLTEVWPSSVGLTAFVAWAFNMAVTGAFALAGFVLPTHRLLPEAYYRITHPERLQAIYTGAGVDVFRGVLLATAWRDRAMRARFFDGSARGLDHLAVQSRSAEVGHVLPWVVLTAASAVWMARGAVLLGVLTLAFNTLGNLYPVLLQRHHRMRIQRLRRLRAAPRSPRPRTAASSLPP